MVAINTGSAALRMSFTMWLLTLLATIIGVLIGVGLLS